MLQNRIPREWVGQTAAIFGGGPSLTKEDVAYCIERGWKRIACNDAYVLDPEAEVLCWSDPRWFLWNSADLKNHRGKYKICWRRIRPPSGVPIMMLQRGTGPLSLRQTSIVGNNTGQGAINIAFLFGAARIVLLGFDMRKIEGRHNWHERHKEGTDDWRYERMFSPAIARQAPELKRRGVQVFNCTPGSALKCFPFGDLRSL